jgi:hypothetical protein
MAGGGVDGGSIRSPSGTDQAAGVLRSSGRARGAKDQGAEMMFSTTQVRGSKDSRARPSKNVGLTIKPTSRVFYKQANPHCNFVTLFARLSISPHVADNRYLRGITRVYIIASHVSWALYIIVLYISVAEVCRKRVRFK